MTFVTDLNDVTMTVKDFITKNREAFGESEHLPVAFGYRDTAAAAVRKRPR